MCTISEWFKSQQYSFHGSKVSAVCSIIFSKSTEYNHQIFTGFYAYTKVKTIEWGFFKYLFLEILTGKFWEYQNKSNGFSDCKNEYEGAF